MRKLISVCVCLLLVLNSFSQEFCTHWISYPDSNDSSQVWFRHTYFPHLLPKQVSLAVASQGKFQVFVNERNVSTDILLPGEKGNNKDIVSICFDITRYIRSDSNTIAIWYAPTNSNPTDKQISATVFGIGHNGKKFAYFSDGTWLTHIAFGWNKGETEGFDNSKYNKEWRKITTDTDDWQWAAKPKDNKLYHFIEKQCYYKSLKRYHNYSPELSINGNDSIKCSFPKLFTGWIRLTIRNARAGSVLHIGNFSYICNGEIDEQACRRFSIDTQKDVFIWGDGLKISQLQDVEGIEIMPYIHKSYMY
nr:hypothetical protein [Prevotella sp.]